MERCKAGVCKSVVALLAALTYGYALSTSVYAEPAPSDCSDLSKGAVTLTADPKRTLPLRYGHGATPSIVVSTDQRDEEMNVNSDGSPRAYHLLDPRGAAYALNDMPSGGTRVFEEGAEITWSEDGLSKDEIKTRIARYYTVFSRFVSENNNFGISPSRYDPRADVAYKLGDDFGNNLDPPQRSSLFSYFSSFTDIFTSPDLELFAARRSGDLAAALRSPLDAATYNCLPCLRTACQVCFKRAIVASDDGNNLCIRRSGRYAGFLVNKTSLDRFAAHAPDPENAEDITCSVPVNVDPEKLPGLVLPGGHLSPDDVADLHAAIGDIVVGYDPTTEKWSFGVVSDGGPKGKLGEASIAFNRTLSLGYKAGAQYPRPLSYRGNLLGKPYQPLRPIHLLLLPGTRAAFKLPPPASGDKSFDFSPATVAGKAKAAFLAWASSSDLDAARKRFKSCIASLAR